MFGCRVHGPTSFHKYKDEDPRNNPFYPSPGDRGASQKSGELEMHHSGISGNRPNQGELLSCAAIIDNVK